MSEFMEKIAAASGVPVDKQNLLFRGRRLVVCWRVCSAVLSVSRQSCGCAGDG